MVHIAGKDMNPKNNYGLLVSIYSTWKYGVAHNLFIIQTDNKYHLGDCDPNGYYKEITSPIPTESPSTHSIDSTPNPSSDTAQPSPCPTQAPSIVVMGDFRIRRYGDLGMIGSNARSVYISYCWQNQMGAYCMMHLSILWRIQVIRFKR